MITPKFQTGLTHFDEAKATAGYTLFSPAGLTQTHLIDMKGEIVHQWDLPDIPGNYAYLLANGNLLAATRTTEGPMGLPAKEGVFAQATKELIRDGALGDRTYQAVEHLIGPAQTIDLIVLVGYYSLLGRVISSLKVELDEGT